jgi:hypothetical protein
MLLTAPLTILGLPFANGKDVAETPFYQMLQNTAHHTHFLILDCQSLPDLA